KRSAEQETALEKLMGEQLDLSSPHYHKWLTPEQFGKQFGPSDEDLRTITAWLASHGFSDLHVSTGRTLLEFSGTAARVQEAFHTTIHKYAIDGREHWANATDPLIPAALTRLIAGVGTLHNFPVRIGAHAVRSVSRRNSVTPQTNIPSPCDASGLQTTGTC